MDYDPTCYTLHDALIEAIEYDAENQRLVLTLELNLALAVKFDPHSNTDDFRQTRLIFTGVQSITPPLPIFEPQSNCYADVLAFNWNIQKTQGAVHILLNFFDPLKKLEEFIATSIDYQTVEWHVDEPYAAS